MRKNHPSATTVHELLKEIQFKSRKDNNSKDLADFQKHFLAVYTPKKRDPIELAYVAALTKLETMCVFFKPQLASGIGG